MKKPKSPCIDVCNFSGPNGWCLGCGRTRNECQRWKKMKPYEIKNINKELNKRLNKIIISALKQSKRATIPKLNNAEKFEDFIKKKFKSKKYIATCNTNLKKELLSKMIEKSKNIIILIGPEGGFTNNEIELASNNNFNFVSLGRNTLRTETSGIVACQTVKIINDEN